VLERFAAALDAADVERAGRREELLAGLVFELRQRTSDSCASRTKCGSGYETLKMRALP